MVSVCVPAASVSWASRIRSAPFSTCGETGGSNVACTSPTPLTWKTTLESGALKPLMLVGMGSGSTGLPSAAVTSTVPVSYAPTKLNVLDNCVSARSFSVARV